MKKLPIIKSNISVGSYSETIDHICALGQKRNSSYVCCANVHMIVEAYKDPTFNQVLNQADIATTDGMPLAKFMSLTYGIKQERVAGMDLFPSLLKRASEDGLSIFFYGDTDGVLEELVEKIGQKHPKIKIAGYYSPPFRVLEESEKLEIIERINNTNPNLVFIALGCPKQENWMAVHKGSINACMLGVGNAFRTFIGKEQRAPIWMQKFSLEWVYRLVQNPKRLWKRYFYTNTMFLLLSIRYLMINRKQKHTLHLKTH